MAPPRPPTFGEPAHEIAGPPAICGLLCLTRTFADTYAYPLSAESLAVDAGRCLLATDQRGVARPAGVGCDIGAMEYDPWTGLGEAVYLSAVMR